MRSLASARASAAASPPMRRNSSRMRGAYSSQWPSASMIGWVRRERSFRALVGSLVSMATSKSSSVRGDDTRLRNSCSTIGCGGRICTDDLRVMRGKAVYVSRATRPASARRPLVFGLHIPGAKAEFESPVGQEVHGSGCGADQRRHRRERLGEMIRHGQRRAAKVFELARLVPFQLNWPNRSDAIQRMAQPAERSMAMSQVSVDPLPAYPVARVVSVREREALEHAELGFDEVEPRGLRRRRHRLDAQPPQQRQEARMIMDVAQVVHDHEEPLVRIA